MSSVVSKTETKILELYLNDVFKNECEFKGLMSEEFVFIQTGIEKFVHRIVDVTTERVRKYAESRQNNTESTDVILYQRQQGQQIRVKEAANHDIIKVGSFYEITRNTFPDEFDFIFYMHQANILDPNETKNLTSVIIIVAEEYKESLTYSSPCDVFNTTRQLYFDKCPGIHGPAAYLQFIYKSGHGKPRVIDVDIVPAVKITNEMGYDLNWYKEHIIEKMKPKSFREQVLTHENYLMINRRPSFTETEVHFIRDVLLRKHVKLYRIMKFLLNGHAQLLDSFMYFAYEKKGFKTSCFCSYQIKVMMIFHHDECTNKTSDDIGPCVLQVLGEMIKHADSGQYLTLFGPEYAKESQSPLLPHLKSLMECLENMRTFSGKYEYKSNKLNTVPMQYLNALDKTDPKNDVWLKYLDFLLEEEEPSYDSWSEFITLFREENK